VIGGKTPEKRASFSFFSEGQYDYRKFFGPSQEKHKGGEWWGERET
jgi:hypothetical protein